MTEKNSMLGFARKLLYRAASAIERHGDKNYYFLGFENKVDHIRAFDLLLKLFERKSAGIELKFWRLVDIAAKMDEPDQASFRLKTAISGVGFFEGISAEGGEYLLEKAYRRGISLRRARMYKEMWSMSLDIMRNSMYGVLPSKYAQSLPRGSIFIAEDGKIKVKI